MSEREFRKLEITRKKKKEKKKTREKTANFLVNSIENLGKGQLC